MYQLDIVPAVPYRDPWHASFEQRLAQLSRQGLRVAYYYPNPDSSTFRYRAYNMAQSLNQNVNSSVSASYFFHADLKRSDAIAAAADLLVLCRARYDHAVAYLIAQFKRLGKKVLFDVDDLVFDTDYTHLLMHSLQVNMEDPTLWDNWFAYMSRMGQTLRQCDAAIATNDFLAQRMKDYVDIPIGVVPNFMNYEQLEISERIMQTKKSSNWARMDSGLLHVGYFSGSPSHNKDFAIVAPALESLMAADERLGLVLVAHIEPTPGLRRFASRIKHYPFQDYLNLQRLIGQVEINLMPLQTNAFTDCKSELKYFEAAAVGSLSVASPSFTYSRAIEHGKNGWIAQAHQWKAVLQQAIDQLNCGDRVMMDQAYTHATAHYSPSAQYQAILSALSPA
jgi:glycosyltransferase involved in cell wall biosynthesis